MDRELELGLIRLTVLAEAALSPVYGVRLLENLSRKGFRIGYGTLYPLLHRLEMDNLLAREDRVEGGRVRKYYRTTSAGRSALAAARERLSDVQLALSEYAEDSPVIAEEPIAPLIDLTSFRAWQSGTSREQPTLLDVRSAPEYHDGHVPGARSLPHDELSSRLEELDPARRVVTYCTMRHRGASRSEHAARLLRGHGFEAWALDGGLPAWVRADLPLERSSAAS